MAAATLLLFLSFGIGLGIFSCIFFLWTCLVDSPANAIVWIQLVTSVAAAATLVRAALPLKIELRRFDKADVLFLLLSGIILYQVVLFAIHCLNQPHGEWDAWAIWNLHARFLYRAGAQWTDMFHAALYWTHSDYPLLLPSLVAGGWTLIGWEATLVPTFLAFFFTIATAGLVIAASTMLGNQWRGLVAGVVLLSTPNFLLRGTHQQGDIPLAFYFVLTTTFMLLSERFKSNLSMFLAGMSAAFAAWTKNEGLLFVLVFTVAWLLSMYVTQNRTAGFKKVLSFAAGAIPVIVMILILKFGVVPRNDLFVEPGTMSSKLVDVSRYSRIAASFRRELADFGGGHVKGVYALAVLGAFVLVDTQRRKLQRGLLCLALVIAFMAAGYFMVYLITPRDLQWHLDSSLERLFIQLWPLTVFAVACFGIPISNETMAAPAQTAPEHERMMWLRVAVASGLVAGAALSLTLSSPDVEAPFDQPVLAVEQTTTAATIHVDEPEGKSFLIRDPRPFVAGYAALERIEGMAILGHHTGTKSASEAVISPSVPARAMVFPFKFTDGFKTSLAIVNAESRAVQITLSNVGQTDRTFELPGNTQISKFIDEYPFRVRGSVGVVRIRASSPVAVSAFLTFDPVGSAFFVTTLPIASTDAALRAARTIPLALSGDGWSTELILVNPFPQTLQGEYHLLNANGQVIANYPYRIESEQYVNHQLPGSFEGRIQIIPEHKIEPVSAAVLRRDGNGLSALLTVPAVPDEADQRLYVESSTLAETEIRLVNTGRNAQVVRIAVGNTTSDHAVGANASFTIPISSLGGYQLSSTPVRRMVKISSTKTISAAALRWIGRGAERRLLSVYASNRPGSLFPYFVSGSDFSMQFILSGHGALNVLSPVGKPFAVAFIGQ